MGTFFFLGGAYAMYQYLGLALIIKFTAYKILVVERYFNFIRFSSFGFQDLGVVGVVGRYSPPYLPLPPGSLNFPTPKNQENEDF